jgi:hypothetical protein
MTTEEGAANIAETIVPSADVGQADTASSVREASANPLAATFQRQAYPVALLASLSIWFLAVRAPLWLDETLSYWQVSGGFAKVWTRSALMPSSIGYLYTLWCAKSIFGTSELALKLPSTFALLAAVFFLFRFVRELIDTETAFLTCIFFCLEGNVVFAATDARPYAFAMLASVVACFAFVRWLDRRQMGNAIGLGASLAGILYFHYLFGSLLPAFAAYYLIARWRQVKDDWRQLAAMLASFTLFSLPLIYRVLSLYNTRQTHIVQEMRHPWLIVLNTLVPQQTLIGFVVAVFLAALARKIKLPERDEFPAILFGPLLALVPAGILITLSTATPAHLLIPRYLSVAAPGAALTWALLTRRLDSRWLRQIFVVGLVGLTVYEFWAAPDTRRHELSFQPVHAFVNAIVTPNELPVLVCSAFIESNYEAMPDGRNPEDPLLSQTDYYPIHAPVQYLPMALNEDSMRIGAQAVQVAMLRHQRFLAIAAPDSYKTMDWIAEASRGSFTPHVLANFNDIVVAEFRPVDQP